jgi:hypothetical protein
VVCVIDAAGKGVIVDGAATPLKPRKQARACIVLQFKLDGPAGLLLYDDRASADLTATNQIADLDLHDIAAPQLAIDRQVEERPVSMASMLIEEEPYRPDLTRFQRPFCAHFAPGVPAANLARNRVELCLSHRHTPSASMAEGLK